MAGRLSEPSFLIDGILAAGLGMLGSSPEYYQDWAKDHGFSPA